jgi:hypothetical protein
MTDIEKAAELASTVLPGPIGEALSRFLSDGVATADAEANPYLTELADRIVYADEIRKSVLTLVPEHYSHFYHGLAVQLASSREVFNVADAIRLADATVKYLFALADDAPGEHAPRGYVNATARIVYLHERISTYNAELVGLTRTLGGGAA